MVLGEFDLAIARGLEGGRGRVGRSLSTEDGMPICDSGLVSLLKMGKGSHESWIER